MSGIVVRLDRLAFGILPVILILTPWPLGSRLPWASMLAAGTVVAVGAIWLAGALVGDRDFIWNPLFVPIVLFLGWTALQWAAGWTIYPYATAYEWVRYLSYAVVFALTVHVARDAGRCRLLAGVITVMAIAVGLFGLVQFLTWNGHLYWIYDPPYSGTRFGPFNNRNYFAGYMVATLALPLGLIFSGGITRGRAVITFLASIAALSVLVSLSRGGTVALAVVVGMVIALGRRPRGLIEWLWTREEPGHERSKYGAFGRRALLAVAVLAVVLVGLGWLQQADRVLARVETIFEFDEGLPFQSRVRMWQDSLPMVAARPVVGFGLNTFGWVFSEYRTEPVSSFSMHTHNEYLEMLIETGLVGGAICLWFVLLLYRHGWRRLGQSGHRWERGVRLGALAGWTGILVYAITDFPTIIPAIDYVLAVLAGLATVRIEPPSGGAEP